MRQVACISYGKDSLAQLEVMHRNNMEITDIVTVDIMATTNIPAYLPELVDFRNRVDKEIKQRYGLDVTHIKAEKSFVDLFYRELTSRSIYTGIWGWPPVFGHWCMRILKKEPLDKHFAGLDCVRWLGIAADEPGRFAQLNEKTRSALVEHGVVEKEAMRICKELNWVAPTYLHAGRDGCWFCPCQSLPSLRRLYNDFPEYWSLMMEWDKDTEKRFQIQHTLSDFDCRFKMEKNGLVPSDGTFRWSMMEEYRDQISLFDLEVCE